MKGKRDRAACAVRELTDSGRLRRTEWRILHFTEERSLLISTEIKNILPQRGICCMKVIKKL